MIIDAGLLLANAIAFILVQLFGILTFIIPAQVLNSIGYFIGHARFLRGYIDIDTFFIVAGSYIDFLILLYIWKIIRWAFAHVPFIGSHHHAPKLHKPKGHE